MANYTTLPMQVRSVPAEDPVQSRVVRYVFDCVILCNPLAEVCDVSIQKGIHFGGAAGGNRHHWHLGGATATGGSSGPRGRPADELWE